MGPGGQDDPKGLRAAHIDAVVVETIGNVYLGEIHGAPSRVRSVLGSAGAVGAARFRIASHIASL